jgi:hypothetical protein
LAKNLAALIRKKSNLEFVSAESLAAVVLNLVECATWGRFYESILAVIYEHHCFSSPFSNFSFSSTVFLTIMS